MVPVVDVMDNLKTPTPNSNATGLNYDGGDDENIFKYNTIHPTIRVYLHNNSNTLI